MTAVMTTLMPFNEEIKTVFCTDNMTNNILTLPQYVWRSHSQEPWRDGNWDGFHHLHTQYFTMEGVHRGWIRNCIKGVEPGGLGSSGPQYGLVQIPGRGSGGQSPPEAEAKCESTIFNVFLCKFFDSWIQQQSLESIFVQTHAQLKNSKYWTGSNPLTAILIMPVGFTVLPCPDYKRSGVSEWVEFNAPPDTIQVISEAGKRSGGATGEQLR